MARYSFASGLLLMAMTFASTTAVSDSANLCATLPSWAQLKTALISAVAVETIGLDLQMWGTIVDRDGFVCAVAFSGLNRAANWPGSRVISAAKANTANAFSLDNSSFSGTPASGKSTGLALSTANLYTATQPGNPLFGLIDTNPVDAAAAYDGKAVAYGTNKDPMVGNRIGGVVVFGGGLALYGPGGVLLGGLGLSGDTACADHRIAWRVRNNLGLDYLKGVGGVSGDALRPDNIAYTSPPAAAGFTHPDCGNGDNPSDLPAVRP